MVDALSRTLFETSVPEGLASLPAQGAGGLEAMVSLAVTLIMLVGAWQVIKGGILLREAAEGGRSFWRAVTHITGGVLCLNIRAFVLALGSTLGGSLESTARTLLGG